LAALSGSFRYLADVRQFRVTSDVQKELPCVESSTVVFLVCDRVANLPAYESCHDEWLTWKIISILYNGVLGSNHVA
jgi:hypothetical protein